MRTFHLLLLSAGGCTPLPGDLAETGTDTAGPELPDSTPEDCGGAPPEVHVDVSFMALDFGAGPGQVVIESKWYSLDVRVRDRDGELEAWTLEVWASLHGGEVDLSRPPDWREEVRTWEPTEPCSTPESSQGWGGPVFEEPEALFVVGEPYRLVVRVTDAGGARSAPFWVEGTVPADL